MATRRTRIRARGRGTERSEHHVVCSLQSLKAVQSLHADESVAIAVRRASSRSAAGRAAAEVAAAEAAKADTTASQALQAAVLTVRSRFAEMSQHESLGFTLLSGGGNRCFLNALLYALWSTPLRSYLMNPDDRARRSTSRSGRLGVALTELSSRMEDVTLRQLNIAVVSKEGKEPLARVIIRRPLAVTTIRELLPIHRTGCHEQGDPHEAFVGMMETLNNLRDGTPAANGLTGLLKTTAEASITLACGHKRGLAPHDPAGWSMELPLGETCELHGGKASVVQCLQRHMAANPTTVRCDICAKECSDSRDATQWMTVKKAQFAEKGWDETHWEECTTVDGVSYVSVPGNVNYKFTTAPRMLALMFKRVNNDGFQLRNKVTLPDEFDMPAETVSLASDVSSASYRKLAVIWHVLSADVVLKAFSKTSGHFFATFFNKATNMWWYASDEEVMPLDIAGKCAGPSRTLEKARAFMVFYELASNTSSTTEPLMATAVTEQSVTAEQRERRVLTASEGSRSPSPSPQHVQTPTARVPRRVNSAEVVVSDGTDSPTPSGEQSPRAESPLSVGAASNNGSVGEKHPSLEALLGTDSSVEDAGSPSGRTEGFAVEQLEQGSSQILAFLNAPQASLGASSLWCQSRSEATHSAAFDWSAPEAPDGCSSPPMHWQRVMAQVIDARGRGGFDRRQPAESDAADDTDSGGGAVSPADILPAEETIRLERAADARHSGRRVTAARMMSNVPMDESTQDTTQSDGDSDLSDRSASLQSSSDDSSGSSSDDDSNRWHGRPEARQSSEFAYYASDDMIDLSARRLIEAHAAGCPDPQMAVVYCAPQAVVPTRSVPRSAMLPSNVSRFTIWRVEGVPVLAIAGRVVDGLDVSLPRRIEVHAPRVLFPLPDGSSDAAATERMSIMANLRDTAAFTLGGPLINVAANVRVDVFISSEMEAALASRWPESVCNAKRDARWTVGTLADTLLRKGARADFLDIERLGSYLTSLRDVNSPDLRKFPPPPEFLLEQQQDFFEPNASWQGCLACWSDVQSMAATGSRKVYTNVGCPQQCPYCEVTIGGWQRDKWSPLVAHWRMKGHPVNEFPPEMYEAAGACSCEHCHGLFMSRGIGRHMKSCAPKDPEHRTADLCRLIEQAQANEDAHHSLNAVQKFAKRLWLCDSFKLPASPGMVLRSMENIPPNVTASFEMAIWLLFSVITQADSLVAELSDAMGTDTQDADSDDMEACDVPQARRFCADALITKAFHACTWFAWLCMGNIDQPRGGKRSRARHSRVQYAKLNGWCEGNFEQLFTAAYDEQSRWKRAVEVRERTRSATAPVHSPEDLLRKRNDARAMKLGKNGHLSRARMATASHGVHDASRDQVVNRLKELHLPEDDSMLMDESDSIAAGTRGIKLTMESFHHALKTMSMHAAPGPFGIRADWLAYLIRGGRIERQRKAHVVEVLFKFASRFASGELPAGVLRLLTSAILTPLKKSQACSDVDIRPIAVGSPLWRVTGRAVATQSKKMLERILLPLQVGVGTPNGVEYLVKKALRSLYVEDGPKRVLVAFDAQNAFGSVHRKSLFEAVTVLTPSLVTFLKATYGHTSRLYIRRRNDEAVLIQSRRGVMQGDCMGPAWFALVLHPALRAIREKQMELHALDAPILLPPPTPDLGEDLPGAPTTREPVGPTTRAFLDDITVTDTPKNAFELAQFTESACREIGLTIHRRGGKSWCLRSEASMSMEGWKGSDGKYWADVVDDDVATDAPANEYRGRFLLGVPIGCSAALRDSSKVDVVCAKILKPFRELLKALLRITLHSPNEGSGQVTFNLLVYCAANMYGHLARVLSPDDSGLLMETCDEAVFNTLCEMTQLDPKDQMGPDQYNASGRGSAEAAVKALRTRVFSPHRYSGCGLREYAVHNVAAFLACSLSVGKMNGRVDVLERRRVRALNGQHSLDSASIEHCFLTGAWKLVGTEEVRKAHETLTTLVKDQPYRSDSDPRDDSIPGSNSNRHIGLPAIVDLLLVDRDDSVQVRQRGFSRMVDNERFKVSMNDGCTSSALRATWLSAAQPWASVWLRGVPFRKALTMCNRDRNIALHLRLGCAMPNSAGLDPEVRKGRRALNAERQLVANKHKSMLVSCRRLLKQAGGDVEKGEPVLRNSAVALRADIGYRPSSSEKEVLLDFSSATVGHDGNLLQRSTIVPCVVGCEREKRKVHKYASAARAQGALFCPLVMETPGAFAPRFRQLLRSAAELAVTNGRFATAAGFINRAVGELSVIFQIGNARCIAASLDRALGFDRPRQDRDPEVRQCLHEQRFGCEGVYDDFMNASCCRPRD